MAAPRTRQEPDAYVTPARWLFAAPLDKSTPVVVPAGFKVTQVKARANAPALMRCRPDTTGSNVSHATSYTARKVRLHNASFR